MNNRVSITRLPSGVLGLDEILGGGVPEFSFNLIAGAPGSGKTTLAHQIMFSAAHPDRRALFFTVLGESPVKMLRYQQQFPFFDFDKINTSIKFVNLAADLLEGDFSEVLSRISEEVRNFSPSLVFVDSFRSVIETLKTSKGDITGLQQFVLQLGMQMAGWQATTFLIGEYGGTDEESGPVFTIADGILGLSQRMQGDSMVRKIQVVKMRGQAQRPGLHTFRINDTGIHIFPRMILIPGASERYEVSGSERLSMGIPKLDEMLGGGLPAAYSLLLAGPTGSGKTLLATQFLAEGVRVGEPGIIAAFEKSPNQLLSHKLNDLIKQGRVGLISMRDLDLSIDETLHDLVKLIEHMKAKRVVIDSLSGFELTLAPVFRENFREALYRMISVLTGMGVTVLMTAELEDRYEDLRFSSYGGAFLADAILMLRYVQIAGQFRRVISVVKVRGSAHSKEIRLFEITTDRITIDDCLTDVEGILSGAPTFT